MAANKDYWLRHKRDGYGAEPANWMGWLATGVFLVAVLMITSFVMIEPVLGGREVSDTTTFLAWLGLVALILAFIGYAGSRPTAPGAGAGAAATSGAKQTQS